jgi:large subunit ribosomal protein L3e
VRKVPGLKQKRAHLIEIQVNGGTPAAKVDFATGLFEKVRARGARVCDV